MVKNAKNDDEVQSVLKPLTPDLRLSWDSYFAPERLREELMHIAVSWPFSSKLVLLPPLGSRV